MRKLFNGVRPRIQRSILQQGWKGFQGKVLEGKRNEQEKRGLLTVVLLNRCRLSVGFKKNVQPVQRGGNIKN